MVKSLMLGGDPPVELHLRRSARARRLSLRVSAVDGHVTLTVPRSASEAEARAFANERGDWLRAQLGELSAPVTVTHGAALPLDGRMHAVIPGDGRSVRIADGAVLVPGRADQVAGRLAGFLRERARARFAALIRGHCAALGRPPGRLTLRDPRTRWGSCSSRGDLMFSWRLVMAPPAVADYVAAHEVAHLAQMNHSPAFWAELARLCPGWRTHRAWLRREGPGLLRYRF